MLRETLINLAMNEFGRSIKAMEDCIGASSFSVACCDKAKRRLSRSIRFLSFASKADFTACSAQINKINCAPQGVDVAIIRNVVRAQLIALEDCIKASLMTQRFSSLRTKLIGNKLQPPAGLGKSGKTSNRR